MIVWVVLPWLMVLDIVDTALFWIFLFQCSDDRGDYVRSDLNGVRKPDRSLLNSLTIHCWKKLRRKAGKFPGFSNSEIACSKRVIVIRDIRAVGVPGAGGVDVGGLCPLSVGSAHG